MLIVDTIQILRGEIRHWREEGKRIAFVPTMGNLHFGHLTLVTEARKISDRVVVSIFVNAMQFDDTNDFEKYPRTFQDDCEKLKNLDVDLIFCPSHNIMFPAGTQDQTYVEVPKLSDILEGASRPRHFRGVTTVACKLFNLVEPDVVLLGEKDFQQLHILRKMVSDLEFNMEVVGVPTVRDENGLALSSRNSLLSEEQRCIASNLYRVMVNVGEKLINGERDVDGILAEANDQLCNVGFTPEPIFIKDAVTLQSLGEGSRKAVILMAARLGKIRLIDNLIVDL